MPHWFTPVACPGAFIGKIRDLVTKLLASIPDDNRRESAYSDDNNVMINRLCIGLCG